MPAPRRPVLPEVLARVAALAARQGGLVQWAQVVAAGLTDSQVRTMVRAGDLVRVRRGVLALPEAASVARPHLLNTAARWMSVPTGCVLSHESAAALHGLPDITPPAMASFLVPRTWRGAVAGARLGALPEHHVELLHGMRVTTLARTVSDLLRCAEGPQVAQVLADDALRHGAPRAGVAAVLEECLGWPGIRQARTAWTEADSRSESPLESRHRVLFREAGLPAPEQQVWIHDERGRRVARVDFLFRDRWTVVESDGRVKYDDPRATDGTAKRPDRVLWEEKLREDRLRDLGFEVVRATWADAVDGGKQLLARLDRAFVRAASRHAA